MVVSKALQALALKIDQLSSDLAGTASRESRSFAPQFYQSRLNLLLFAFALFLELVGEIRFANITQRNTRFGIRGMGISMIRWFHELVSATFAKNMTAGFRHNGP